LTHKPVTDIFLHSINAVKTMEAHMPVFQASELLNIAVKDEETGIAFYRTLAEKTSNVDLKEHLLAISKQEEMHANRFREMLKDVGDYKPQERYTGEYEDYLNTLLEMRAFPGPEEAIAKAQTITSDSEAISISLKLEKDTLLFLSELKNFVSDAHQEYIDAVIEEEREHLKELGELQKKLS
jgi:rubrerythrin